MKKYILGLIILAALGLAISIPFGGAINEPTKHYQNGEISFDYPDTWQVSGQAQGSQIVAFKDPESGMNVTVNRQIIPNGYNIPQGFVPEAIKESESNLKLISSNNANFNGTNGYENTYQIQKNGSTTIQKELWVNTNGALYSVIFSYPQEQGSGIQSLFGGGSKGDAAVNAVKKSLKINSAKLTNNFIFGTVSIPRTGVTWNIRTDTVNAYNGVYHYPESAYPGQIGSVGLIGHHTIYSAPFNHVENIQVGDSVYIKDYLTQKKYTYKVVSNNDIRYDYTTNTIKFPANSKELVLATCWPPTSTAAERYVHCKLSSVDPL